MHKKLVESNVDHSNGEGNAMNRSQSSVRLLLGGLAALFGSVSAVFAGDVGALELVAVEFNTGDVFTVSLADASLSFRGATGVSDLGSLEMSPNGTLYGFTTGLAPAPTLYSFDLADFSPTEIGTLNQNNIFDGSLVFAPDGTAYGTNRGSTPVADLFTLDLATGTATVVGSISVDGDTQHDINAMAWRSDGMLVGLDRVTNSLLAIDPSDASATVIAEVTPEVGSIGGMAALGDFGYFSTAGGGAGVPGSNELYLFDLFTGVHLPIGEFNGIDPTGFSGLAFVPEPATALLLSAGAFSVLRRRRR